MVRGGGVGRRSQTSQAGGGGGSPVGKGLVAVAGGTTFVAGLVGYASWSDSNRKVSGGVAGHPALTFKGLGRQLFINY